MRSLGVAVEIVLSVIPLSVVTAFRLVTKSKTMEFFEKIEKERLTANFGGGGQLEIKISKKSHFFSNMQK